MRRDNDRRREAQRDEEIRKEISERCREMHRDSKTQIQMQRGLCLRGVLSSNS